jgi:PilZ domain-containing protein
LKVTKESIESFTVEFESDEELRHEFEANLSAGGLFLASTERPEPMSTIRLRLTLSEGGSFAASATVVRLFEGGFAVSIDANPEEILSSLTARPEAPHKEAESAGAKPPSVWDRVRAMTYAEKIILAAKADRSERAVLIQDNDPQLLYYLLKNPRITTEEVLRIARMTSISAAVADQIAKTAQWSTNQEIRSALVNNPRTPTPLALKLLPTLPEPEIRHIAKSGGVSQALKQAALRIVTSRG